VLDQSLGYSLRRAQLSTYSEFTRFMEKFDVRPSQFTVLVLLRYNPGLTQSAVSTVLSIQKANLVSLLDGLEERGLIERRSVASDRRAFALYLTRPGETFTKKMEAGHVKLETSIRKRLGDASSAQLLRLLHAFSK
jgi:DNA-binding MarR family transcriptional regulator